MVEHLVDSDGILLRRNALIEGVDDNALARMAKRGDIERLRQGAYVLGDIWRQSDPVDRHLLLIKAVMQQYGDDVAASHTSALLLQGGPSWGQDLRTAHVTSLQGKGERTAARLRHHRGTCRVDDVTRLGGHWITSPARTALDTASTLKRDAAVCVLDDFLSRGLATQEQYDAQFVAKKEWPDSLSLHHTLQLSRYGAESVGETRTRLACRDAHLPEPLLQFVVRYRSGEIAGRVDMCWPQYRLMLEFDGRIKYERLRRPGESVHETVMREKAREDLLRELTGFAMLRVVWTDLDRPHELALRARRLMTTAA
ncbi:hypothetical protein GCM10027020_11180 [Nocardioides salsibiostraticola]